VYTEQYTNMLCKLFKTCSWVIVLSRKALGKWRKSDNVDKKYFVFNIFDAMEVSTKGSIYMKKLETELFLSSLDSEAMELSLSIFSFLTRQYCSN